MSIVKKIFLALFVLLYVGSGIRHFVEPDFYVKMMPPYIPAHLELVYLSGVVELVLGILILVPKLRVRVAWATIAMLLSFMPVHIHMALNPELYPEVPSLALWIRIPFQGLFALHAFWFTRPDSSRA